MPLHDLFRRQARSPSIYEHIRSHVRRDGPGLTEGGETLPDEAEVDGPIRWAAGAQDGVAVYHMGVPPEGELTHEAVALVMRAATGGDRDFAELERRLRDINALSIADSLLERIAASPPRPLKLEALGRRLATTSRYRNPVKIGIALLGVLGTQRHRDVFMTLGRHDEFTLYSATALTNTEPEADTRLWELGKLVEGWGRIHVVERLKDTTRPEIKDWILREGFRNRVMIEYLAPIAATTGGLAEALEQERPDPEVLDAAAEILSAMVDPNGPSERLPIHDYADAPRAIELFLRHVNEEAPRRLQHFLAVDQIEQFLARQGAAAGVDEQHWPSALDQRLLTLCREIKARPDWETTAAAGLASDDDGTFYQAVHVARAVGVSPLDALVRRVTADPIGGAWYELMEQVGDVTVDSVLELAERLLPLEQIAMGPGVEYGLGPRFRAHQELGFVVQKLQRFPGKGWPLIAAALRRPVVSNRNMALNALDTWDRSQWPAEVQPLLARAVEEEPDPKVRERLERLTREGRDGHGGRDLTGGGGLRSS